jgi:hypothetical protein
MNATQRRKNLEQCASKKEKCVDCPSVKRLDKEINGNGTPASLAFNVTVF